MAPLACGKQVTTVSIWLPVKRGDVLLLKETFLRNRRTKIHGSLCFQKKIMGWKKWRYNLIFTDLEAGMRSTEFHFCFLVGASKHHHFLRMGSIFSLNFHPYLACKNIQNTLQSGSEITLSFSVFSYLINLSVVGLPVCAWGPVWKSGHTVLGSWLFWTKICTVTCLTST